MPERPRALYIHLPWCEAKCPYCDFNSYALKGGLREADYVDALIADLKRECERIGRFELDSIFIGGGTPSLFSAPEIERLLGAVASIGSVVEGAEITLEANPGSAEAKRFEGYRKAGVNRLSIGIQSFHDPHLRSLGRVHTGADARRAIGLARAAGFENINLDLMFGLPDAVPGQALDDLAVAISHAPEHLSWYELTLEPDTAFARRPPPLPSHDVIADDYEAGLQLLEDAGYKQYEISAYAVRDRECRHNLNYWNYGDYLGIGAGAHGKLTCDEGVIRSRRIKSPLRYMDLVLRGQAPFELEPVVEGDRLCDFAINALRLREGFSRQGIREAIGDQAAAAFEKCLHTAVTRGWLECRGDRISPTKLGFRFLNELQLLFVDG